MAEKYFFKAIEYQKDFNQESMNYSDTITVPMLSLAQMYNYHIQNYGATERYYLITIDECNNAKKIDCDKHKSSFVKTRGYHQTNKLVGKIV